MLATLGQRIYRALCWPKSRPPHGSRSQTWSGIFPPFCCLSKFLDNTSLTSWRHGYRRFLSQPHSSDRCSTSPRKSFHQARPKIRKKFYLPAEPISISLTKLAIECCPIVVEKRPTKLYILALLLWRAFTGALVPESHTKLWRPIHVEDSFGLSGIRQCWVCRRLNHPSTNPTQILGIQVPKFVTTVSVLHTPRN